MTQKTTKQAQMLFNTLTQAGIHCWLEHYDGHKHIDIRIPDAMLDIEVDGVIHLVSASQIIRDIQRDDYSNHEGFHTLHIPNEAIEHHLGELSDALIEVIKRRTKK